MIVEKNFEFIKHQIETSHNEDHLNTCRKMIEERIALWGAWNMVDQLYGFIQVREAELLIARYPEVEG